MDLNQFGRVQYKFMKHILANPTMIHLMLGVLGLLAVISVAWLWFMIKYPARWAQLVDKENDYWVGKGLISAAAADWFRRFEKGMGQKILVALAVLISGGGLVYMAMLFAHHK